MNSKNLFRLSSFAAVAGLGLGLLAAGCGDSGSTTPAPLGKTYSVVYEYTAAPAATRTLLAADITGVQYDFLNNAGKFVSDTDMFEIEHADEAENNNFVVENVDESVTSSVAYYFNEKDEIVALGYDALTFGKDDGKAVVSNPAIDTEFAAHIDNMVAVAEPANINIDQTSQVSVSADYTVDGKTVGIDLTNRGTYSADKEDVVKADAKKAGLFTGKAFGEATVTFVPAMTMVVGFVNPVCTINVTDAKLTAVEIRYGENETKDLGFLLPDFNFGVGNVVFSEITDLNATDAATVEMRLVGKFTTETEGAKDYEETLTEGIDWSIDGVATAEPEFVGEDGENGVYNVTAKKAMATEESASVKAEFAIPGSEVFSDTLTIGSADAVANVEFVMVKKTIGGVEYPNEDMEIPSGGTEAWVVNADATYTVGDNVTNTFSGAKAINEVAELVTNPVAGPAPVLSYDKEADVLNLLVPSYMVDTVDNPYYVTLIAELVKDDAPKTATWHAIVAE